MSELRAGMMCIIVGSISVQENIGKICQLVEFIKPKSTFILPVDNFPIFYEGNIDAWTVVGDGIVSAAGYSGYAIVRPAFLIPLKGDTDFTQEEQLIYEEIVA